MAKKTGARLTELPALDRCYIFLGLRYFQVETVLKMQLI